MSATTTTSATTATTATTVSDLATTAPATDLATTATTATVPATLTWETKAGKAKSAHAATGAALAPRAVRLSAAQAADLAMLQSGQYRPVLADILSAVTGAKLAGLRNHVAQSLCQIVDGVLMAPAGEVLTANKRVMLAVAEWCATPTTAKTVKGVTTVAPCTLTKSQATLAAALVEWATLEAARLN